METILYLRTDGTYGRTDVCTDSGNTVCSIEKWLGHKNKSKPKIYNNDNDNSNSFDIGYDKNKKKQTKMYINML